MVATASDSLSFLDDLSNDTVDYLYTGVQCIEERDGGNTVQRQYVWGAYVDELIQQRDIGTPDVDYYPLTDLLYRTVALTKADKSIEEVYDCDAYGNTLVYDTAGTDTDWFTDDDHLDVPQDPTCQFIFTGRRYDPETSNATTQIYFYRARYYHPQLGRFISQEPRGYTEGMNLYEYVNSNVLILTDPTGQAIVTKLIIITVLGIAITVLVKVLLPRYEHLAAQQDLSKNPRIKEALELLAPWKRSCDKPGKKRRGATAKQDMTRLIDAGYVVGNPKGKEWGTTTAKKKTVLPTHPDLSVSDLASAILGEWQRRPEGAHGYRPGQQEKMNLELDEFEEYLKKIGRPPTPGFKYRHPTPRRT